jgi:hypothetical protein
VRADVLGLCGPRANGLLQVALALSAYSLPFVTNGVWGYLHPLASKHGDTFETKQELLRVLRIVVLLSSFGSLAVLSVPELLIWLAYTGEFTDSLRFFPAQFLGDYFYFFAFTTGVFFLATSKLRIYVLGWVAYYGIYLICTKLLLPIVGALAPTIGHCLASCTLAGVCVYWLVADMKLRLRDLSPFAAGGALVAIAALLLFVGTSVWLRMAILAVPIAIYGALALRTEWAAKPHGSKS